MNNAADRYLQTWDGIIQGERLLTMSCSDKLARWNVVGVQGAILSHIIDPIYLKTLVIGSVFHKAHLERAVHGRIEHLKVTDYIICANVQSMTW